MTLSLTGRSCVSFLPVTMKYWKQITVKTAVDLMEQYHEEIAIVLMDIVMPIMDGLEALDIMNGKGPD